MPAVYRVYSRSLHSQTLNDGVGSLLVLVDRSETNSATCCALAFDAAACVDDMASVDYRAFLEPFVAFRQLHAMRFSDLVVFNFSILSQKS